MFKGFKQIASLTLLSRIFGLIREMIFAYFFGAGATLDSWFIAFKIPNLARRLFGEGAASASVIPVYTEQLHTQPEQADRLASTVVSVIVIILSALVALGWLLLGGAKLLTTQTNEASLVIALTSLMLPYMVMICIVAILAGILNVHKHFTMPAAAPVILNIIIIASTIISAKILNVSEDQNVFFIAASVLIAGFVQIGILIYPLKKNKIKICPAWDIKSQYFKKILILMGPMILGLTATQLNTLADDIIAWFFSGSEEKGQILTFFGRQLEYPLQRGSVSHLNFAQRLYQFPLGVFGISLATAIFPVLSSFAAKKDMAGLTKTISKGIKGAVTIAIPSSVGLILVANLIIPLLFQRGKFDAQAAQLTSWTLYFYSIGLCGYFCQQIMTRSYYSLQNSKGPAISASIAVIANIILNLILIWPLGTGGLALSTAICSYLQVIILITLLKKRFEHKILDGLLITAIKTAAATVVMFAAGWASLKFTACLGNNLKFNILRLLVVIAVSAVVYIAMVNILNIKAVKDIIRRKA